MEGEAILLPEINSNLDTSPIRANTSQYASPLTRKEADDMTDKTFVSKGGNVCINEYLSRERQIADNNLYEANINLFSSYDNPNKKRERKTSQGERTSNKPAT